MKSVILLFIFLVITGYPQKLDRESIKNSPDYYWGEASSGDRALSSLTESIAVRVLNGSEIKIVETSMNNVNETYESVIKTYSIATLKNVKTDNCQTCENKVFKYIERKEVDKVFEARKELVRNIYAGAEKFKEAGNFGEALKRYYFALVLMNSLPDHSIEHEGGNLITVIPDRITGIIRELKFDFISDKQLGNERIIEFTVTGAANKPAAYLEFCFIDQEDTVDACAKDGRGVFKLFGSSSDLDKLEFQIKYSFPEAKDEIKSVGELWDLVLKPSFKNIIPVSLNEIRRNKPPNEEKANPSGTNTKNTYSAPGKSAFSMQLSDRKQQCPVLQKISEATLPLLELMKNKDLTGLNNHLARDGFLKKKIGDMMKYNSIVFTNFSVEGSVSKTATGWEMRKVEVLADYKTLKKQSREYLVFDYDSEGNLYDVNFGISETAYKSFLEKNPTMKDWNKKQAMIKFVEKYRTAYLDRDTATVASLFSDDAVIIVGRTLPTRKLQKDEMYNYIQLAGQPNFAQVKLTKDAYLTSLSNMFTSRKDIFLGFSTLGISKKDGQEDLFGLSMRQNFASTGYADEGYLFLLVDFKAALPQIYVRSWQPQEYNEDMLIQLGNFNKNK